MVLLVKLLPVDVERKLRSYLASCRDTIFYHSELKDSKDSHSRLYQLCRLLGPGTRVLVRTGAKDIKLLLLFPFASAAQTHNTDSKGATMINVSSARFGQRHNLVNITSYIRDY